MMDADSPARRHAFARYLAIASGEGDLAELDALFSPAFVGHIGERTRDLAQVKRDIDAYRASVDNVRFRVEHRFGTGPFVAARVSATATRRSDGAELVASGINISRWDEDRLAEEWAVWEPLHARDPEPPMGPAKASRDIR